MPLSRKDFSDEVIDEAISINLNDMNLEERHLAKGYTIDAPDSKDLDDGINLRKVGDKYIAEVSIADVTSFIKFNSALYNSALDRLETIYLPNGKIPMLPYVISEDQLSLLPDGLRPAITFFITITKTGEIEHLEMKETTFRNIKKTSYREFDYIVSNDINSEHHEIFSDILNVAEILILKRRSKGALAIYDLKRGIYTNEEGIVKSMTKQTSFKGNLVVQEFSLLANMAVAWYFANADIPFLFRNHTTKQSSPDRSEIIDQMNKSILDPKLFVSLQDRTQLWFNRAEYSPKVIGHFGLNEPVYAHITSPLRRFADIVNHFIIKAHIKGDKGPFEFDELADVAEDINRGLRRDIVDKSDYFKMKTRKESKSLLKKILDSELETINDSNYINLLRAAVNSDSISDKFKESIYTRLSSSNLSLIMLYIILFKSDRSIELWREISMHIIQYLSESKGLVYQLLNILSQKEIIKDFSVEIDEQEGYFSVSSSALYDDESYVTHQPCTAIRKKDAVNKSAYELLQLMLGINIKSSKLEAENATDGLNVRFEAGLTDNPDNPHEFGINTQENHVGKLLELCMITPNLNHPKYEFKITGQSHAPVINCEAEIVCGDLTIKTSAVASSKKEAKQLATGKILDELNNQNLLIIDTPQKSKPTIAQNYIGKVNELCIKLNLMEPEYQFSQSGMMHSLTFSCIMTIKTKGQIKEFAADASTKKEAKHKAAELCYNYLKNTFQQIL